jgi:transcriptional regulator with XRE-family HTH domain
MAQQSSTKHKRNIREMGTWLRRLRLDRGVRQQDVGAAIGRGIQYVCDVEQGRRGHRMDPVIALLWCDYLHADPQVMFTYLGMGDTDMARFRVQHYLETGKWAHRFMNAARKLDEAGPLIEQMLADTRARDPRKQELFQIRDAIFSAREALRIPRNDSGADQ